MDNEIKIFYSKYEPVNIDVLKNKKIIAFAGIGNPENFFNLLRDYDVNIIEELKFPDHYNYSENELDKLSKVTRDNTNNIVDEFHKTISIMTKYEKTRILGIRTKQLNNGNIPYVSVDEGLNNNYLIALKELNEKRLPFIIKRPMPNNKFEYWKLTDLEIL